MTWVPEATTEKRCSHASVPATVEVPEGTPGASGLLALPRRRSIRSMTWMSTIRPCASQ